MAKAKLDKFEQTFFSIALDEEEITLNDVNSFLRAKAEGKTLDGLSDIVGMKKEVFSSISEKAKIVLEEGNSEDDGSAELKNESDSYDADNSDIQEKGDTILNINAVKGTDSAGLEGKLDLNIDSKETLFGGITSNAENAETQVKGAARVGAQENVAPVISFPKPLNPKSVTKQIMTQVHEGEERYKDLKELGRGGMGAVYRAWDSYLGRDVALKMILKQNEDAITRFLREAHLSAKLDHPNIMIVHDISKMDGKFFLSMKFVSSGKDLEGILLENFPDYDPQKRKSRTDEPKSRNDFLRIVRSVCNGMAYAHSKGVIHRDLKPANIMIDEQEQVYVADWGLAKQIIDADGNFIEEDPLMSASIVPNNEDVALSTCQLTEYGATVGSPLWMAPEQADPGMTLKIGDSEKKLRVDTRSDIYAVGAILYECLTGKRFRDTSKGMPGVIMDTINNNFILPRKINSTISKDLEAILIRALDKDPDKRYQSFDEFGEDLRCILDGEKVSPATYTYPASDKVVRWIGKHKVASSIGAVVLLLGGLAGGIGGPIIAGLSADKARLSAEKTKIVEDELARAKRRNLASEEYWRGDEALKRGELERALEGFTKASEIDSEWGDAYFGMGRAAHRITLTGDRTHRKGIEEYLTKANELSVNATGRIDIRALVELGMAAGDIDGDIVKANKFLEQVLTVAGEPEGSDDPYAVLAGSIVAYNQGNIPRAIELGNKAVNMSRMAEAYLHLSRLLSPRAIFGLHDRRLDASSDYARAKQLALTAAEELDKNNWMMHQQASALYIKDEEYEKALKEVEKIHNLGIKSQGVDYLEGTALQRLRRYDEALSVLNESEKRWGQRWDIAIAKGHVYFNSNYPDNLGLAEAEFRRSLSLKKTAEAEGCMACVFERQKQYEEALKWHDEAIKSAPDSEENYERRGGCYDLMGNVKNARADYEAAIERGSKPALFWMGSLLLRKGKGDEDYTRALEYTDRYLASGDKEQRAKAERMREVIRSKMKK